MTPPPHLCNLCGAGPVPVDLDMGPHPIAHRFRSSPEDPEYTHPLRLGRCGTCGLVQLVDPVPPEELYTNYNWLSSWKWNPQVPRLIELLGEYAALDPEAPVLEVGCNDGAFLRALREAGYTRTLGVEPARDAVEAARSQDTEAVLGYFDPDLALRLREEHGPFQLLVSRHVLEHIPDLRAFLGAMELALAPGGCLLLEVPDFRLAMEVADYSALWEEHVNHFTPDFLTGVLERHGFEVLHQEVAVFSGEALITVARRVGDGASPEAPDWPRCADLDRGYPVFCEQWSGFRDGLRDFLRAERAAGKRLAVFGAGGRTCCLVNFADVEGFLDCVVDDQEEKQGLYLAGTSLPILPSGALLERDIDLCLLAVNAENEPKVRERNRAFLDAGGRFLSVHPPSPDLPGFWQQWTRRSRDG